MRKMLRKLFGIQNSPRSAARQRPVKLNLESLDDRILMSVSPVGDVTGFTYGNQYASNDRTVARSSSTGNYAVTWQGSGYGGNGIYTRLFRADNTPLTAPIHIGATTSANDFSPSVTMNASGQFAVAWTHRYSSTDLDIHAQRFNANGTLSGTERVVAASTRNETEPSAALDVNGNLMVAYTSETTAANRDVYVWTQRTSGATYTTAVANTTNNEHAPSLAVNPAGSGVVAFEYDYSSSDHDIYARRVTTGGYSGTPGVVGASIVVNANTAYQYDPSVSINSSNSFVVSYTESQSSGGSQVFARRFNGSNAYQGQISVGDLSDTRAEFQSSVAMDEYGRFLVAYTRAFSSSDWDVMAQAFNSDNVPRSGSFYVAGSGSYEYSPTVALGISDLTYNYSGSGYYYGQAVFGYQTYGLKTNGSGANGSGVSVARGYNL